MHVHPGYREKSADFERDTQATHVICTEYEGSRDHTLKIGMHIKENLQEACAHEFSLLVLLVFPIHLQGCMLLIIHSCVPCIYKPTV